MRASNALLKISNLIFSHSSPGDVSKVIEKASIGKGCLGEARDAVRIGCVKTEAAHSTTYAALHPKGMIRHLNRRVLSNQN